MYVNALVSRVQARARRRMPAVLVFTALSLCAGAALAGPHIQHWQAPSGAQVYFVENHDLPIVDVAVNFPAGSGFDTARRSGLAAMTQDMLKHGARGMNEDEISRGLADVGAELNGNFDQDRAGLSLRMLSAPAERDPALQVLAAVLQHPSFPAAILAREKARTVAALKDEESQPEAIAVKAFARAVYGDHPYALPQNGEIATVRKIGRSDVAEFYRAHYGAGHAVVALMGDLTRAQAEAIAQQLTGQLPPGGAPAEIPPVTMHINASELRIPHPATQSHILMGAPGMTRTDPDYFTLYVGNYILGGGGFVSRLMQNVREQHGMAYSVYSYFFPLQQAGLFQIGLQTKKSQAYQALDLVRTTVDRFIKDGPTEQELQAAKDNIIGGFPLRIDSNRKIVEYLAMIGFYHLPLTYLDDFTGKVQKVSVADIRTAFRRRIDPAAMATVIVAPPAPAGTGK
ncbi:MAG TPA: pitrilysin family protein [Gallionellaceae bacterium]|nr:pitrilysin family protein [Gallionellaceae bacterium]